MVNCHVSIEIREPVEKSATEKIDKWITVEKRSGKDDATVDNDENVSSTT